MTEPSIRFSITPFLNTRQYYFALERGIVSPEGCRVAVEQNHSPVKDQGLLCGRLDATTMSMGKYVTAKLVSHTDVLPADPAVLAAGLTYRRGNGLFVRQAGGIDDPADLAGARVGVHDNSLAMVYHKAVLEEGYGVDPADVEWVVDDHRRLGERFDTGGIDAVERVNDWYWELRTGDDHDLLYDLGEEWADIHDYHPLVHLICVDRSAYEDDPDRYRAFLDALRRSRDYRDDHYDDVLAAFAEEGAGEWSGGGDRESLRRLTSGVRCPFVLGDDQRRNVRDWMRLADRYGVFESVPLDDGRLFPV